MKTTLLTVLALAAPGCQTETVYVNPPAAQDEGAPTPEDTTTEPDVAPDTVDPEPDPCEGVSFTGCCEGTTLKYCQEDGTLKVVDCSVAPPPKVKGCGWDIDIYNCENDNGADPDGTHPLECP